VLGSPVTPSAYLIT